MFGVVLPTGSSRTPTSVYHAPEHLESAFPALDSGKLLACFDVKTESLAGCGGEPKGRVCASWGIWAMEGVEPLIEKESWQASSKVIRLAKGFLVDSSHVMDGLWPQHGCHVSHQRG